MSEITAPARVALVGNPNSGKTALFNALTGSRQKVANYPGVTVERKEGLAVTPAGLTVGLIDLPGTYSLRARSLDEIVTRDIVLGRLAGEEVPALLVCVADSTNLRLALRLALELKRVGRPMILALNMFDIARHRGLDIDIERLSAELGIPVVASVAVRRGGTNDLLARIDEVIRERGLPRASDWTEPNAAQLRATQREANRILDAAVRIPGRPDLFTRRLDRIVLHPVLGLVILLAVLFLMFQAVFTWAQAPMDLIKSGLDGMAVWAAAVLPEGWLLSFVRDGVISGVGSVLVFLPQILTLFLFILLLEDFGYMARAAFLMDRIMGGAGLHGRAFIPLLSSFACAIPGIMATRVISSRRGRLATILVAPLMTCSARIPVYTLIISAFVPRRSVLGWLSLQGRRRNVVAVVNHFADAMRIVAESDLLTCVPNRFFDRHHAAIVPADGLVSRELPFAAENILYKLVWHERVHAHPAHQWFRSLVAEACGGPASGPTRTKASRAKRRGPRRARKNSRI